MQSRTACGLCRREDHWNLRRAFHALDAVDESEFAVEHLLVKEEQRAESLVLCGSGHVFIYGQMREKRGDLLLAHFVRVAFAMKENVTANPIDVGLLCADRVMFHPQMPPDPIE